MRIIFSIFATILLSFSLSYSQDLNINIQDIVNNKGNYTARIPQSLEAKVISILISPENSASKYYKLAKELESLKNQNQKNIYTSLYLASMYSELSRKAKKRKDRNQYLTLSEQLFFESQAKLEIAGDNLLTFTLFLLIGQSNIYEKNNKSLLEVGFNYLDKAEKVLDTGIKPAKDLLILLHEKRALYFNEMKMKSEYEAEKLIINKLRTKL